MIITRKVQTESLIVTNDAPTSIFSWSLEFDDGSFEVVLKETFDSVEVGDDVQMVVQVVPVKKAILANPAPVQVIS